MGLLEQKAAIVTGASRGIGRAIALRFAEEGACVGLIARSVERLEALKEEIEGRGGTAVVAPADISHREQIVGAVDRCEKEFGRVDILVNNAGITRDNLAIRLSADDWEDVIKTNLNGAFFASQAVLRTMMRQRAGCIINMSSIIGLNGNAGQANYAAAKAGLIALTKSLAKELGSRGVRVNAVAPGFVETDMTAGLSEDVKKAALEAIPLRRFGTPEDIANACVFLASDQASFITGHVLIVDGGMAM